MLETTKSFLENFIVELNVIIPEDASIQMTAIGLLKYVPKQVAQVHTDKDKTSVLNL